MQRVIMGCVVKTVLGMIWINREATQDQRKGADMDVELDTGLDMHRTYSAKRPLLGLTILLIEDSRFCSEAVRLMCLKSGARLRRADSLRAAARHLATYRPSVVLVDLGLPDGSGLEVIRDLASLKPAAPHIIATSGDDPIEAKYESMLAGADGFMPKPLQNLRYFQAELLALFPERRVNTGTNVLALPVTVHPDPLAKIEDLRFALGLLQDVSGGDDGPTIDYCAQFLGSVAKAGGDLELAGLAAGFSAAKGGVATIISALQRRVIGSHML